MIRWIMESQGWNPVVMPVTEVYLAIQQGTVDGQENPVDTIFSQRFYEVAKHITLSNHVYSPLWLCAAERTWNSLPKNARDALMQAGRESGQHNRRQVAANDDAVAGENTNALISNFTLPADGQYIIIATHFGAQYGGTTGTYSLTLTILN